VYYGSALTEVSACLGQDVYIVGGANSAGQAAVFFSEYARSVTILCRARELGAKMSTYLVEQIEARQNILVRCGTSIRSLGGGDRLASVTILDAASGGTEDLAASALFVFIGASPRTDWLPPQIARDARGFILTGPALGERRHRTLDGGERDPFLYETSAPGVFAVGDVRASSVKRVASAVGEGSVAVQFVHQVLRR
jgi:thioredoxin reductase (NADPH)